MNSPPLDPLPINLNTTYTVLFVSFFFHFHFFKIHPYTNIDVLFFQSHIEKHDSMIFFFVRVFFVFFKERDGGGGVCFLLSFSSFSLHQGQVMYIEMLYATDKPSGTPTWNSVQCLSWETEKKDSMKD